MGKIKLIRFPNTFRIEFSEKEFVCNKGHYSLDNIEQKRRKDNLLNKKLSFKGIFQKSLGLGQTLQPLEQRKTTVSTFVKFW